MVRFIFEKDCRFHVAVCLFSDHSWRQNVVRTKKEAHEPLGKCVADVFTTFEENKR